MLVFWFVFMYSIVFVCICTTVVSCLDYYIKNPVFLARGAFLVELPFKLRSGGREPVKGVWTFSYATLHFLFNKAILKFLFDSPHVRCWQQRWHADMNLDILRSKFLQTQGARTLYIIVQTWRFSSSFLCGPWKLLRVIQQNIEKWCRFAMQKGRGWIPVEWKQEASKFAPCSLYRHLTSENWKKGPYHYLIIHHECLCFFACFSHPLSFYFRMTTANSMLRRIQHAAVSAKMLNEFPSGTGMGCPLW